MTTHRFDPATGNHCKQCGVLKGCHAEECVAPENLIALQPYLAKRRAEGKGLWPSEPWHNLTPQEEAAGHGLDWPPPSELARLGQWFEKAEGKIIVEGFPKPPPESA